MGFYESKWLNEHNLNKPKFYLEYLDDILAAFEVFISGINNQNLTLQTYHKLTYTGLLLNFHHFHIRLV